MEEVTIYTIDGKDYIELDRIKYLEKNYVYLVNDNNDEDILIQEYRPETPDEFYGVASEDYLNILKEFRRKFEED